MFQELEGTFWKVILQFISDANYQQTKENHKDAKWASEIFSFSPFLLISLPFQNEIEIICANSCILNIIY